MASQFLLIFTLFVLPMQARKLGNNGPSSTSTSSSNHNWQALLENAADKSRLLETEQSNIVDYHLWEAHEFHDILQDWQTKYPDLVRVTTSQEKYGLPRAGGDDDCPFVSGAGCPNYMLTLQDFVAHPEDSSSSSHLPEVFWSGCLHGNERVGPTAVIEAAALLLESATCEAKPTYAGELEDAKKCRQALKEKGIDDVHRKWLARLVTTRRIIITPTTNALGYFRNIREENTIDPNRDFPYDVTDPKICMRTIAGRTVNEIYREHMFQLALTFHGGMEVIGYEWGAPTWLHKFSPDHEAQSQIAAAYSRFGGGWSTSRPYKYGTMNDEVYFVRGGMEDWAYAGSWDPERVIPCEPTTFGGYPKEKSVYNNSTLRIFNMLVETSTRKEPRKNELGSSLDVLDRDTTGNGHVSRNIRLALLSADLVEPYVSFVGVNSLTLTDDVVPLTERGERSCQKTKAVTVQGNSDKVEIEWTVGGAVNVDQTEVWYAKWDDIPTDQLNCLTQPSTTNGFKKGTPIGSINGTGVFSRAGSQPRSGSDSNPGSEPALGPVFRASIDLSSGFNKMDQIVVIASARVDKEWADAPNNVGPNVPAQSHIVNARTNPDWHHHNAGKHLVGRLDWYSIPLTIVIGDYKDSIGTQGDHQVDTVELFNRFGDSTATGTAGVRPKSAEKDQLWFPLGFLEILVLVLAVWSCSLLLCFCVRQRKQSGGRPRHGKNSEDGFSDDDDFVFDAKPYSDKGGGVVDDDENEIELPTLA
jgi:hypothetical protein